MTKNPLKHKSAPTRGEATVMIVVVVVIVAAIAIGRIYGGG